MFWRVILFLFCFFLGQTAVVMPLCYLFSLHKVAIPIYIQLKSFLLLLSKKEEKASLLAYLKLNSNCRFNSVTYSCEPVTRRWSWSCNSVSPWGITKSDPLKMRTKMTSPVNGNERKDIPSKSVFLNVISCNDVSVLPSKAKIFGDCISAFNKAFVYVNMEKTSISSLRNSSSFSIDSTRQITRSTPALFIIRLISAFKRESPVETTTISAK